MVGRPFDDRPLHHGAMNHFGAVVHCIGSARRVTAMAWRDIGTMPPQIPPSNGAWSRAASRRAASRGAATAGLGTNPIAMAVARISAVGRIVDPRVDIYLAASGATRDRIVQVTKQSSAANMFGTWPIHAAVDASTAGMVSCRSASVAAGRARWLARGGLDNLMRSTGITVVRRAATSRGSHRAAPNDRHHGRTMNFHHGNPFPIKPTFDSQTYRPVESLESRKSL
jgi:hypothetical protein